MRVLEQVLAQLSLRLVEEIDRLWEPCGRCSTVRWRFHRHAPVQLHAVASLPQWRNGALRGGDDVA